MLGSNGIVGTHNTSLTDDGTIIIGRKGSIGEVHLSSEGCWPIDTTYYINEFYGQPPKFWFYLLKELDLGSYNRATAIPGLTREDVYQIEVNIPPLSEQRRIVAKLDSLFARTRRAREELARIPTLIKHYKEAVLAAAFRGELTAKWRAENPQSPSLLNNLPEQNYRRRLRRASSTDETAEFCQPFELPDTWRWIPLPILGTLDRGRSKHRPRNDRRLFGGPYPFIQTGEIKAANGTLKFYEQTYSEFGLSQSRLWPRGTVCITIAANIAETAILEIEACFPDSVVGFIAKPQLCMPAFVEFFIRTVRDDLARFAPATAQKNINLNTLSKLHVPIPPLEEQRAILEKLENAYGHIDRIKIELERASVLLDHLDQAALAKAFRGELIPQDPNDEPASVLLERIRAARAQMTDSPRGRRRGKQAELDF